MDLTTDPQEHMQKKAKRKISLIQGFTMFEMVVMLAIITAISTVVLFSFTGLNQGVSLNRSVRELLLALRRGQNMSFAVTAIQTNMGLVVPKAVGIALSLDDPSRYIIFGDMNLNGKYDLASDAEISLIFDRNTKVVEFNLCSSSCPRTVNVIFSSPEATMTLTGVDASGSVFDIGERLDIVLAGPNITKTKTISVRTSGQISVK